MLDDETNAPLLIMSFILHVTSEANLEMWTIKNILSRVNLHFYSKKLRNLEACYCQNRH